jgi:drug/metabolite transporter (DMT)-like permease
LTTPIRLESCFAMLILLAVSLLWAFSFGIIKTALADLPSPAVAVIRLGFALLIFIPFLRPSLIAKRTAAWLAGIGAIQFGVMYLLYLQAFQRLQAHEVALFTILTPLYVALLDGALENRLAPRHAAAAGLSVLGAGVLAWGGVGTPNFIIGFFVVQGANFCFATGQVAYKRTRPALPDLGDTHLFAWLMVGAFLVTALAAGPLVNWPDFSPTSFQWGVLAFLGLVASGLGFFAWNLGALRVNTGTLAALNNAKVPLGVLVSLIFFGEHAHRDRLAVSFVLLAAAVWLAESARKKPAAPEETTG